MAPRDRDVLVRKDTPRAGVPVEIPGETTDTYGGEALARIRSRRPTPERIAHVETRVDGVVKDVGEIKGTVNSIKTMLEQDREEKRLERQLRAQTEAGQVGLETVRLNSRAKIIVSVIGLLGVIAGVVGTLLAKVGS